MLPVVPVFEDKHPNLRCSHCVQMLVLVKVFKGVKVLKVVISTRRRHSRVGASFEFGETLQNFVDRTCPAGCSRLKCKHKYKVSQAP